MEEDPNEYITELEKSYKIDQSKIAELTSQVTSLTGANKDANIIQSLFFIFLPFNYLCT